MGNGDEELGVVGPGVRIRVNAIKADRFEGQVSEAGAGGVHPTAGSGRCTCP